MKRLGVMGGGFFTLRFPIVGAGGGDEGISANEERRPLEAGDGDDIVHQGRMSQQQLIERKEDGERHRW